ncbi:alpha/beta hydrolase family protein [Candidatus Thiothrix anitrata]|uniref:Alpha/beta hydrolase n=1 Tax=Candidatus Thiothrix anitrata TaxID=2823902 RepID=A0ABX7X031_9GAMM|nr:hypothetical protein [Candidatus Thiothrix anitrata]QTR49252.1 hypothetical protein J8380_13425 [Candidatus Thiothrix anitrata]
MSIIKEICDSNTLIIAFTGYANKLNIPVNAFFLKSDLVSASKLIVFDESKRKTLGGLPPEHPTFFDVLNHLKNEIKSISANKIIITGTSGGGHSALLYGHLLQADKVVAFSPYPYVSIKTATLMQDPALHTMKKVLDLFDELPKQEKEFLDLKEVLATWNGKTEYFIHVAKDNEWDLKRALYLQGTPKVRIIEHPYNVHGIAGALARDGKLSKCFI